MWEVREINTSNTRTSNVDFAEVIPVKVNRLSMIHFAAPESIKDLPNIKAAPIKRSKFQEMLFKPLCQLITPNKGKVNETAPITAITAISIPCRLSVVHKRTIKPAIARVFFSAGDKGFLLVAGWIS